MVGVPHAQAVSMSVSSRVRVLLLSKPLRPFVPCFAPCLTTSDPSSTDLGSATCLSHAFMYATLFGLSTGLAGLVCVVSLLGTYLNRPPFSENRWGSPEGDTRQASLPAADYVHPCDSLAGSDTRDKLDQGAIIA